ncbi:MAG: RNA polymerase factor sigma-54 [Lachnospiraceae bacterium]|nr:RNA polymerase factor sigma-54 [Lachnospiraceae bacterium]
MDNSLHLTQNLSQRQILTQKQLQSLNILQMTGVELESLLQNEHLENPMLEYTGTSPQAGAVSWNDNAHFDAVSNVAQTQDDFREVLRAQLQPQRFTGNEHRVMNYLIDAVEDTGYFTQSLDEVAAVTGAEKALVEQCLHVLKQMEPVGVFSKNLSECLLKQLEVMGIDDYELNEIVRNHLEDVAEGHIGNISRALKIPTAQVRKYILLITTLSPRPADGYGSYDAAYLVPDILVDFENGLNIRLNDSWYEDYHISDYYLKLMKESQDAELKAYFEERLKRARFVMEHIAERRKTLTELTRILVTEQMEYVREKGTLKPFTMQEAANRLNVHTSTISRAVKGKVIQFPDRIVEMRMLFCAAATKEGDVNADEIKKALRSMIGEEDASHPLSDQALCDALKKKGISISRRAVAKYRECMGIKGSFDRKTL